MSGTLDRLAAAHNIFESKIAARDHKTSDRISAPRPRPAALSEPLSDSMVTANLRVIEPLQHKSDDPASLSPAYNRCPAAWVVAAAAAVAARAARPGRRHGSGRRPGQRAMIIPVHAGGAADPPNHGSTLHG
jgi:hypothetical protein